MATKAIARLKATAAAKMDPKAQKEFDKALAKLKKARDKKVAEFDKLVTKFKKTYTTDEVIKKELEEQLAFNNGDLYLATEAALDEVDVLIDETLPEFLSIEGH